MMESRIMPEIDINTLAFSDYSSTTGFYIYVANEGNGGGGSTRSSSTTPARIWRPSTPLPTAATFCRRMRPASSDSSMAFLSRPTKPPRPSTPASSDSRRRPRPESSLPAVDISAPHPPAPQSKTVWFRPPSLAS